MARDLLRDADEMLMRRVYVPISHFAGRRFGSTACSLARACIPPVVVFDTIGMVYGDLKGPLWIGVLLCLDLAAMTFWWKQAAAADRTPNPFESENPSGRIFIVFFLVGLSVGQFLFHNIDLLCAMSRMISITSMISYFYFRAVPKPPAKKKKQEAKLLVWGAIPDVS